MAQNLRICLCPCSCLACAVALVFASPLPLPLPLPLLLPRLCLCLCPCFCLAFAFALAFASLLPLPLLLSRCCLCSCSCLACAVALAFASEIGPGFSLDINTHPQTRASAPGTSPLPIPTPQKLFFAKTLSKSACQAPKPPNPMIPNELRGAESPTQTDTIK